MAQRASPAKLPLVDKARRFFEAGLYQEAIDAYAALCVLEPNDPLHRLEYGHAYLKQGRHIDRAIDELRLCISLTREDDETAFASTLLATCYELKQMPDMALNFQATACRLQPDEPDYKERYADMLWAMGRKEDAATMYEIVYSGALRDAHEWLVQRNVPAATDEFNRALGIDYKTFQLDSAKDLVSDVRQTAIKHEFNDLADACTSTLALLRQPAPPQKIEGWQLHLEKNN